MGDRGITIFYSDREPVGPYRVTVPARRTNHLRFNSLTDPEPIPHDTNDASVITSDVPIVVQHTRLDSRQAANALVSTTAFAGNEEQETISRQRSVRNYISGERGSLKATSL